MYVLNTHVCLVIHESCICIVMCVDTSSTLYTLYSLHTPLYTSSTLHTCMPCDTSMSCDVCLVIYASCTFQWHMYARVTHHKTYMCHSHMCLTYMQEWCITRQTCVMYDSYVTLACVQDITHTHTHARHLYVMWYMWCETYVSDIKTSCNTWYV